MSTNYVFSYLDKLESDKVGGKAYRLWDLHGFKVRIPIFLCLSVTAFKSFLNCNNIQLKKRTIAEAGFLQKMILEGDIPKDIKNEFEQKWFKYFPNSDLSNFSIRSSAIGEDSNIQSFAGQFDTILPVEGKLDLIWHAIKQVWASQFNYTVLKYFEHNNCEWRKPLMGVIVQELVNSEISGVLFTMDPVKHKSDVMLLEMVEGFGENLVSGNIVPNRIFINKKHLQIQKENYNSTIIMEDDFIFQLVEIGKRIEKYYIQAQDIEWSYDGKEIFILQTRPITHNIKENDEIIEWTDENVGEVIPDIVTPLTWSIMERITNNGFCCFFKHVGIYHCHQSKLFDLYLGKVYFNRTRFQEILDKFSIRKRIKEIKEKKSNIVKVIITTFQLFWTVVNAFVLIITTPSRNARFLKKHKIKLEKLKCYDDTEDKNHFKLIQGILKIHQKTMNLHIAVTFMGEIFYQGLKSIFNIWNLNSKNVSVDVVLQGLEIVESSTSGFELWELSRLFLKDQKLQELIVMSKSDDLLNRLKTSFSEIYSELQEYLDKYGHGALHEFELIYPRWYENPTYLLNTIRNYIQNEDVTNPKLIQKKLAKERITAINECKKKLTLIKKIIFLWQLKRAQIFMIQRESLKQAFLRGHLLLRQQILKLADEFFDAQKFEHVDDIFFLKIEDIKQIRNNNISYSKINNIIIKNRDERVRNIESFHPKSFRKIGNRIEWDDEDINNNNTTIFKGIGCSAGVAFGRARIINDPTMINSFKKGDILVASSTNPGWTPLFVLAGGVVTEIGGALSHGAIIAREYGIPLVTAIPNITSIVKEGNLISVNGSKGTVEFLNNII